MTPIETAAIQAINLMDLTSLNDNDSPEVIQQLCAHAKTQVGSVAAVCVYPQFIQVAREALQQNGLSEVKIATVTNFPHGDDDVEAARAQTRSAVADGADEVDVVFPYKALMAGNPEVGKTLVAACKQECGDKVQLKVILETGELTSPELIQQACELAIEGGADFLKTSTGKVAVNATLEAAEIMLCCIKASGKSGLGFKAAGGVRSAEEAKDYLDLAVKIMGDDWLSPEHFRFGASSLLNNLLQSLNLQNDNKLQGY